MQDFSKAAIVVDEAHRFMDNSRLFRRGDGTGRRAGLTMARLRDIAAQANVSKANVKPQSGGRSHNEVAV